MHLQLLRKYAQTHKIKEICSLLMPGGLVTKRAKEELGKFQKLCSLCL